MGSEQPPGRLYHSQGAQFGASAAAIRRRPRAWHREMLEELRRRPHIKKLLEENEELALLLEGAPALDTPPDEDDPDSLHERMKVLHTLIKQLHAFRAALAKVNFAAEGLPPALEQKLRELRKALKVLPPMEEVGKVLELTKMIGGLQALNSGEAVPKRQTAGGPRSRKGQQQQKPPRRPWPQEEEAADDSDMVVEDHDEL